MSKESRSLMGFSIPLSPHIAEAFGVSSALILQQLHYWLTDTSNGKPHVWVAKPIHKWVDDMRVYNEKTVRRNLETLEELGIIMTSFRGSNRDRTKSYGIDYIRLAELLDQRLPPEVVIPFGLPFGLNVHSHSDMVPTSLLQGDSLLETMVKPSAPPLLKPALHYLSGEDMKTPSSASAILADLKAKKGTAPAKTANTAASAQQIWKEVVPAHNESVKFIPEFTIKDKGQFSHIAKRLGPTADKVLGHVLSHWIGYAKFVAKQRALKKTPDAPDLGFLLKYAGDAASFWHEAGTPDELPSPVTDVNPVQLTALKIKKAVILQPPAKVLPIKAVPKPSEPDTEESSDPESEGAASIEDILKWAPAKKE